MLQNVIFYRFDLTSVCKIMFKAGWYGQGERKDQSNYLEKPK